MTSPRLYIAGPMSPESFCTCDTTPKSLCPPHRNDEPWHFNYAEFDKWEQALISVGYEVASPASVRDVPGWGWAQYMRSGLNMLLTCDGVGLLHGWERSRGAQLEVHIAQQLGMEVRPVFDWFTHLKNLR